VLATTRQVVDAARQVRLDPGAIEAVAGRLVVRQVQRPAWNQHYHFAGTPAETALAILVLDALNFCFWGEPRWRIAFDGETLNGYWALAAALKRAFLRGQLPLTAAGLAAADLPTLRRVLAGEGEIPLLPERLANLHEVGAGLRDRWGGDIRRLIEAADGQAAALAGLIAREFPSFDDRTNYLRRDVGFYKRAQIVVADLWGAFAGEGLGAIAGMEALTAFADYKVPQVLRELGILAYDDRLAALVDGQIELAAGSTEEVEIRAATIWGVEELRRALARRGLTLRAFEVDWLLWEEGQQLVAARPYHRTRTIYY
jgi:hypothetical protein